jgi:hypothetical protein
MLVVASLGPQAGSATVYEDYSSAYYAAKAQRRPMLVIINPGSVIDGDAVDLRLVRRSRSRRELLDNYVVTVIDSSSETGRRMASKLRATTRSSPHVVVIDRDQKYQIASTAGTLSPEDWNLLLETHRDGQPPMTQPRNCFS